MYANRIIGVAIPIPNNVKFRRLKMNSVVDVLIANRITSEAGLHGRTIAPKNRPNTNDVVIGFFRNGNFVFGICTGILMLKIRIKLIIPSIMKATGERIDIAFVSDDSSIFENISPTINIDKTIPKVIIHVSFGIIFVSFFVLTCPAR